MAEPNINPSAAWDAFAEAALVTDEQRIQYWRNRAKVEGPRGLGHAYAHAAELHAIKRKDVAARMHTHPSAVTRLFAGSETNPTLDTLVGAALATGLKMKVSFELAQDPDDSPLEIVENF